MLGCACAGVMWICILSRLVKNESNSKIVDDNALTAVFFHPQSVTHESRPSTRGDKHTPPHVHCATHTLYPERTEVIT